MDAKTDVATTKASESSGAGSRRVARVAGLVGLAGGTAVVASGCTLGDISAIISILRFLGIL